MTESYMATSYDQQLTIDGIDYYVPKWFMDKNNLSCIIHYQGSETEKAVKVLARFSRVAYGSDARGNAWIPKSILMDEEAYCAERKERDERFNKNCAYSEYLKQLAADNGVKIGNMSSWEKIQAKLTKNNVAFKTRREF